VEVDLTAAVFNPLFDGFTRFGPEGATIVMLDFVF
jgi:hypothetical protein